MITLSFMALWLANQQPALPNASYMTTTIDRWWAPCCHQIEGGLICKPDCRISFTFQEGTVLP
jgi:hypothetical protein